MQQHSMGVVVISGLFLFVIISVCHCQCPQSRSIQPCTCESGEEQFFTYRGIMTCSNITSDEQLDLLLRSAGDHKIGELIIKSSEVRFFTNGVFQNSQFEHIHIVNSTLSSLSDTDIAFEGLEESLQLLRVENSQFVNNWDWTSLRNVKNLLELRITNSDLIYIPDSFKNLPKTLLKLVITENSIDSIAEGAFKQFEILEVANLRGNQIKSLERNMFPNPATQFKILDLSINKLSAFPRDMFSEMPNLETLDISGNPLLTLDEDSFGNIWGSLKSFTMKDTNLRCDCRLIWISKSSSRPEIDNSECQHPANLRGKALTTLKSRNLVC